MLDTENLINTISKIPHNMVWAIVTVIIEYNAPSKEVYYYTYEISSGLEYVNVDNFKDDSYRAFNNTLLRNAIKRAFGFGMFAFMRDFRSIQCNLTKQEFLAIVIRMLFCGIVLASI